MTNDNARDTERAWELMKKIGFAMLVTRASDAIKAGATRDTLAMQVKTDDLGWTFQPAFYGSLFDELKK